MSNKSSCKLSSASHFPWFGCVTNKYFESDPLKEYSPVSSIVLLPDWDTFKDWEDPLGNFQAYIGGFSGSNAHTHPTGKKYSITQSDGTTRERTATYQDGGPPSSADYKQVRGQDMQGMFNVAVLRDNVHFFNNQGVEFSVSRGGL